MSFPDPLRSTAPLIRSKTAAEWTAGNYDLMPGELGIESDTGNFKVGTGDQWSDIAYTSADPPADGNTYGRRDNEWIDLASAAALQFRQGTDAERLAMDPVPASGEPIYTTDTKRFFIGDGTTTGGRGVVTDSDAYVICQPGDDLLAKYTAAKALTPGGSAKSATNRATLIIYPGSYSIGSSTLTIDTDFVDIIGLGASTWQPTVHVTSSASYQISFGGEDVRVVGLFCTSSKAQSGGEKRYIAYCGGVTNFYNTSAEEFVDGLPLVVKGHLCGCASARGYLPQVGAFGGNASGAAGYNVFAGIAENCYVNRSMFKNTVILGEIRHCYFPDNQFTAFGGAMQGWVQYTRLSFVLPGESHVDDVAPTAFGATCTISNASPAVVTSVAHGLQSGMRIHLATDGALPTGLSAATTYYVKKVDADSFQLSATLNGSSINTSSAGSGSHTVEKPTGRDGGWYTYCTYDTGEYTST